MVRIMMENGKMISHMGLASKFMEVVGFMRVEFVYILRLGSFQEGFKCGFGKLTYPDGSIY